MTQSRTQCGVLCERARSWAALAPDGELSELEQKLLDAHLARCASCSRFAMRVAAVAADLRAAALQPPQRPVAVTTRRRRSLNTRAHTVGAAAAITAMALGIASRAPLPAGQQESFRAPRVVDVSGGDAAEQQALRDLRREAIVAASAARNRPPRQSGNQPAL